MNKLFADYNTSLKLRELGFNDPCMAYFNKSWHTPEELQFPEYHQFDMWNNMNHLVSAPLWSQITDWLRVNHKIEVEISRVFFNHEISYIMYVRYKTGYVLHTTFYKITENMEIMPYEKARQIGIDSALIHLISNKHE
jgi:hypothetical protein